MPETLILNPRKGYDPLYGDSLSPNYGFKTVNPNSRLSVKPSGGHSSSREISNEGRTFTLSWTKRPRATIERLQQIAEQTEDGYFTIVDHDRGGRHYVGNFVGDRPVTQDSNNSHSAQGWTFQETPGAPMVKYPSDWDKWSIPFYAQNDYGESLIATGGANWSVVPPPANAVALDDPYYATLANTGVTVGDFMQVEYRGFGFQLWMNVGPAQGQVQVLLDGTALTSGQVEGAAPVNGMFDLYQPANGGPQLIVSLANVPLDLHRVKVIVLASKNAAATAAGVTFDHLQVMR